VEEVLLAHDAVREAVVVGRPDPLFGERVVAYVVPEPGPRSRANLSDALRALCVEQLSAYKVPEEFVAVARLPHTSTGKVQRHALTLSWECETRLAAYAQESA
jgi:acyl-coenzyme A synthetase/AMP-(fatty) acid ligase